jgi:acyl-CoA synthetase (NDP forming)
MTAQATPPSSIIAKARAEGRSALTESDGKQLLAWYGIKTPGSFVATDAADARAQAAELKGPFVAKVVSRDIIHKSDSGGVSLHLKDAADVEAAIELMAAKPKIAATNVEGWLVEEMVPAGQEMVIGGLRDPQFGPMIMVGLGGIFVEVLKDVAFRICPIDEQEARAMLAELKGAAMLKGARGQASVDEDALVDVMLRIGGEDGLLVALGEDIAETDINPLIVSTSGAIAVDARFILPEGAHGSTPEVHQERRVPLEEFEPLFRPRTVAVLGASTKDVSIANTFIRRLKDFGFAGEIYPIHPQASEVEGLTAYPSLGETPKPVDYAYVAIGANRIPDALAAAAGNCRIAQVISSGFGEVDDGRELEAELIAKARIGGVRVLGPNCLGTYSPRGGLTFPSAAPKEVGEIGVVSQSGGLSTDIIKRGQWRGLRFSGLVTIGNSADVQPHELVEYYLDDPQTKAIGVYMEDVKNGRAFFELMKSAKATKPVVILKGGRSSQGRLAAASHTGALAGDDNAWHALAAQTPVLLVSTVDEFIDVLLMLQHLQLRPTRPTKAITLFGNGGGSSVLGTDAFAAAGLDVSPFQDDARLPLEALKLPPGTSVANPIDTPVRTLQEKDGWVAGEILDIVYRFANTDAVAMHLNLAAFVGRGTVDPIDNLFSVIEQTLKKSPSSAHFALALRTDGSAELDERRRVYREKARRANVPVFDEIPAMARAFAGIGHLERQLAAKGSAR